MSYPGAYEYMLPAFSYAPGFFHMPLVPAFVESRCLLIKSAQLYNNVLYVSSARFTAVQAE